MESVERRAGGVARTARAKANLERLPIAMQGSVRHDGDFQASHLFCLRWLSMRISKSYAASIGHAPPGSLAFPLIFLLSVWLIPLYIGLEMNAFSDVVCFGRNASIH